MSASFATEVAAYLADCARHAQLLSPAYHPTEDGAVKLIFHRGPAQAGQIRAAFRAATAVATAVASHAEPPRRRSGQDPRLTRRDNSKKQFLAPAAARDEGGTSR